MAFKPKSEENKQSKPKSRMAANGKPYLFPVPEAGNQAARISLIVDLGTQEREDFEDPKTHELKPQKPAQQVVVFADLVDQIVDYGGDIGEQQYRLMLNKVYLNQIAGINFTAVPPRDADGNLVEGKMWTFHPQNILTKLAKATGNEQIIGESIEDNMDIEQLLNGAFYADVEVSSKDSGKLNDDGTPLIYHNVSFKGASKLPKIKGATLEIDDLRAKPQVITLSNVTEETLPLLRYNVIEMMKKAKEYEGSKLQQLLGRESKEDIAKPSEETPEALNSQETSTQQDFDDDDVPF